MGGNQKRILKISLPSSTTLIVNVDMAGVDKNILANLVIQLNDLCNGEHVIGNYCGLMWNLYDSSNGNRLFITNDYACVGISDYFFGTILAPSACIQYGALNGSVIAKKTYQNRQESHRFDFTGFEKPDKEPTSEEITEDTTEATTEDFTEK